MLFHTFNINLEKELISSNFVEVQFCKLPATTKLKQIVKVKRINHLQNDSLYIKDIDIFFQQYSQIFNCGIYNNLKSGTVDLFGVNYYSSDLVDAIIDKLKVKKPLDYETLTKWLTKAKEYNGFYVLGI